MQFLWPDFLVLLFWYHIFHSEASARIFMQDYVAASAPVIQYVEKLFFSRDLGIDW